jgi:tetratricopeptide (TPR) repeat protein
LEKEDRKSPYYLYSMAEINLQWAMIRSNFQEFRTAGFEINRANNWLQENAVKFPSFLPNQKELGIINVLLGSLPEGFMKKALGLIGIKGNTQVGIAKLENLVSALPRSPYSHFYGEAVFFLAYIQTDIVKDTSSYDKIMRNAQLIDNNSLLRNYMCGYISMRTGHNNDAISILSNRPSGSGYQPFPYLDYLLGIANMHRLDKSAATFLTSYLKNYDGINYVKDTYLNLAWLALLRGDVAGYKDNISKVKTQGDLYNEKDKQAFKEANDPAPNIDLLKARLLYDGGYYDEAKDILIDKKADSFQSLKDKIEYAYRSGRIYDALGKDDLAIGFYQNTINIGKNERYYFAANSALSIGMIYENRKDYAKAKLYYNIAINMKNHDYENSIESKAKAGLRRIGG